ncbi:GspH/FimT family pseudopilin [Halomonas sp. CS7]|uniref:Type II secretion system protein H n=1 Tax=Halomonas pelophila TaxID=3151122 RepID=A0ABV1N7I2_9GAMM
MAAGNNKHSGFTLIELLVTIAVAVILATIAVPSFQSMIATNRLAADYNAMLAGLNYARSEAVAHREKVTAVLSQVVGGGWRLEVKLDDGSGLGSIDCSDPMDAKCLQVRDKSSSPVSIDSSNVVTFTSLGRLAGIACKKIDVSHDGKTESIRVGLAGKIGNDCA